MEWKLLAEEKQKKAYFSRVSELPSIWRGKLHYVSYVNIPRMLYSCYSAGYIINNPPQVDGWLHNQGALTGQIAAYFGDLLRQIEIASVDVDKIRYPSDFDDLTGLLISFNSVFRTKNGINSPLANTPIPTLTGNLNNDPHIYRSDRFKKLIIPYDPRWLTTSTAFCEFRPPSGQQRISGLGIIKSVNDSTIVASPIIMGLPSTSCDGAILRRLIGESDLL